MKVLVLFVEPMLYGMDLIHEVYEKTGYQFQYVYCTTQLTGKDSLNLPNDSFVCVGNSKKRKKQVLDIFRLFQPDLAIINGYIGLEQTTAIKYCQKEKIPYAIESDTPLHIPKNKLKALMKKMVLRKRLHHSMCYGFPGGTLQKENLVYYGIPEEKNYIMPMSVSSQRLLCAAEKCPNKCDIKKKWNLQDKYVFLFVGRLAPEKNVSLLIEAYASLKDSRPDIALMIVGDGSEMNALKQNVCEKKLEDVRFAGYVVFPDLIQYYKMADAFILPSNYEPWGLVVNEAMIMGLPVIVSDKVGCRKDLVIEEENGFVFGNREELILCMTKMIDFKNNILAVDYWNYQKYLENFENAVRIIWKKKKV